VSERFWGRITKTWRYKLHTQVMREKPFSPALVKDLMDEIKTQIGESAKAGPLGKLEGKLSLWKSQDDNLLNTLHQELYQYESPQRDNDRFALSAEAHALRFAASASAGIKSFNPAKGEIDVGVKCEAAFSLAEGRITTTTYFPSRAGSTLQISYRNAVGDPVRHSFGSFRLNGSLELSCFAGVKGGIEAGIKTGKGAAEGPSGALASLGTPSIDASKAGGRAGLKAEGFAGGEAGGALSGAVYAANDSASFHHCRPCYPSRCPAAFNVCGRTGYLAHPCKLMTINLIAIYTSILRCRWTTPALQAGRCRFPDQTFQTRGSFPLPAI